MRRLLPMLLVGGVLACGWVVCCKRTDRRSCDFIYSREDKLRDLRSRVSIALDLIHRYLGWRKAEKCKVPTGELRSIFWSLLAKPELTLKSFAEGVSNANTGLSRIFDNSRLNTAEQRILLYLAMFCQICYLVCRDLGISFEQLGCDQNSDVKRSWIILDKSSISEFKKDKTFPSHPLLLGYEVFFSERPYGTSAEVLGNFQQKVSGNRFPSEDQMKFRSIIARVIDISHRYNDLIMTSNTKDMAESLSLEPKQQTNYIQHWIVDPILTKNVAGRSIKEISQNLSRITVSDKAKCESHIQKALEYLEEHMLQRNHLTRSQDLADVISKVSTGQLRPTAIFVDRFDKLKIEEFDKLLGNSSNDPNSIEINEYDDANEQLSYSSPNIVGVVSGFYYGQASNIWYPTRRGRVIYSVQRMVGSPSAIRLYFSTCFPMKETASETSYAVNSIEDANRMLSKLKKRP